MGQGVGGGRKNKLWLYCFEILSGNIIWLTPPFQNGLLEIHQSDLCKFKIKCIQLRIFSMFLLETHIN